MSRRISNIVFLALIACVMLGGLARTLFFPKDINYYENRYANKLPPFFPSAFVSGSYQDGFEDALNDQIPLAQQIKKGYNLLTSEYLKRMLIPLLRVSDQYVAFKGGVAIYGGNHLVVYPKPLSSKKSELDLTAQSHNALFASFPEVEFYAYYIERDADINFENGEKTGLSDYVRSMLDLPTDRIGVFAVDSYEQFRRYFYRTDHHWNYKGSYKGYTELTELLDCGEPLQPKGEYLISSVFSGARNSSIGSNLFTEEFYAYDFDFPEMTVTINGAKADDYGIEYKLPELSDDTVRYGSYYGWDNGETVFDTSRPELESILVIGESYDNAILKLLASHFDRTYSIDLRNYASQRYKKFDIESYIAEHGIDKVLLIGNIDFYTMEEFRLGD